MDADEPSATARKARALLEMNRPEEALRMLVAAASAVPDDVMLLCHMAWANLRLDRSDAALEAAGAATALAPDYEWSHRLRAAALARRGRFVEAIRAAREAVSIDPEQSGGWYLLSEISFEAGEYSVAAESAARALLLAPEDPDMYFVAARAATASSDWPRVRELYDEVLRREPNYPIAHLNRAIAVMCLGDGLAGERGLRDALALDPNNRVARDMLAQAVRLQGRHEEAASLQRAADITALQAIEHEVAREASLEPLLERTVVLVSLGRREEARESADETVRLFPRSARAWRLMAVAQFDLGDDDAALRSIRMAHELLPTHPEILGDHADIAAAVGQQAEARDVLRELRAVAPRHRLALAAVAVVAAAEGRWRVVERFAQLLIAARPASCCGHMWLGRALTARGDRTGGRAELEHSERCSACECRSRQALRFDLAVE